MTDLMGVFLSRKSSQLWGKPTYSLILLLLSFPLFFLYGEIDGVLKNIYLSENPQLRLPNLLITEDNGEGWMVTLK